MQILNLFCSWSVGLTDSLCRFFVKTCRLKPTNEVEKKEHLYTINHKKVKCIYKKKLHFFSIVHLKY
jgi:hypothetical protein